MAGRAWPADAAPAGGLARRTEGRVGVTGPRVRLRSLGAESEARTPVGPSTFICFQER